MARRAVVGGGVALVAGLAGWKRVHMASDSRRPRTVYAFGDSVLDCGHYNAAGVTPDGLLVRNDDRLFPEFRGKDLATRGPTVLEHRARDGATVDSLPSQAAGPPGDASGLAVVSVGGNDLLRGLIADPGEGIDDFARALEAFLRRLPIRPVLLCTVYDPSFGDDTRNFLGVDPVLARTNHRRMNAAIAGIAPRYGELADVHAHFLTGDPSWFTHTIEPSLVGASEVRRCLLPRALRA